MKPNFISSLLFLFIGFAVWPLASQVAINGDGSNPDPSAQLDVSATDKGILIPRVSLNSITQTSLDGTNNVPEGLMIYNTNTSLPDGTGFYYFDGSEWQKLIPSGENISVIPIDFSQVTINNTSGQDVPGYDSALEPIFFNPSGKLKVKLIVRCSAVSGNVHFQLRTHDDTQEYWPVVYTDFGVYASTQNGVVATSDWVDWDAGTHAHEIHLFAWVDSGGSATIEAAYLLVKSQ